MEKNLSPGWLGKVVGAASAISIDDRLKQIDAARQMAAREYESLMADLDKQERYILGLK